MTNVSTDVRVALPSSVTRAEAESTEPTDEQKQIAKDYPAGTVKIERSGLKLGLNITGGMLAAGGAITLGAALLGRGGGGVSRALTAPLLIGGGLVAAGGASILGAALAGPEETLAVATKIPTQAKAGEIAGLYAGHKMEVVKTTDGTWAVLDRGPMKSYSSPSYSSGHYYGDGHFHGQHYYGDGHHHHSPGYYEPYYPSYNDYYPTPSYGGGTSRGDDYDYSPSYPSNGGGSTSRGDDYDYDPPSYDPPSYDPPSYDPPSYDPPSYDPPSYDPPSYDPPSYDPPSYDYGGGYGDSSSNGNPSYDDF